MLNEKLIDKIKFELECLKAFFLGFGKLEKVNEIIVIQKDFERLLSQEDTIEENNIVIFSKNFEFVHSNALNFVKDKERDK